jgi:hypothetical protein
VTTSEVNEGEVRDEDTEPAANVEADGESGSDGGGAGGSPRVLAAPLRGVDGAEEGADAITPGATPGTVGAGTAMDVRSTAMSVPCSTM